MTVLPRVIETLRPETRNLEDADDDEGNAHEQERRSAQRYRVLQRADEARLQPNLELRERLPRKHEEQPCSDNDRADDVPLRH